MFDKAEKLEPIDWLTMQKALAELQEAASKKARDAVSMTHSDDKRTTAHNHYWEELAARYTAQAEAYQHLWQVVLPQLKEAA